MIHGRVAVRHHKLRLPRWRGPSLRIVALSDIHACWPWMTSDRLRRIVERANALDADLAVFLGDLPGHLFPSRTYSAIELAAPLAALRAPLGVFGVLGNHDWAGLDIAARPGTDPAPIVAALEDTGMQVLRNQSRRLRFGDTGFWLAGLDSQRAGWNARGRFAGADDQDAALHDVDPEDFVLLLAHEPDIFAQLKRRVDLTLSGHTHGGQIRLFGRAFHVPSQYGRRFDYGAFETDGRHMIVSGGLGYSGIPLRIGIRPEINLVEISEA